MATDRLYELFALWTAGQATPAEVDELETLLADPGLEADVKATLNLLWDRLGVTASLDADTADQIFARVLESGPPVRLQSKRRTLAVICWVAAASILGILMLGGLIWQKQRHSGAGQQPAATAAVDRAPGRYTAVLTLSNGNRILLDSAASGVVATQGTATVQKTANGELYYRNVRPRLSEANATVLNTLATPRGGEYRLLLPDGSKVWLNAGSSITYPVRFTGAQREVEITGEAFFEIAPDAARPFKVRIGPAAGESREIEVLGTTFDVMAYPDEPETQTTLVSGSVRYTAKGQALLLHPGEQARQSNAAPEAPVQLLPDVDTARVIAWTTGFFPFEDLDLSAVLRQISRWYDVNIDDRAGTEAHQRTFGGRISRSLTLSNTLRLLESNKIHFKLDGKTLVVLP